MHPKQAYRNIHIIGAQSTGKTTLFNALRHHYSTPENPKDDIPQFIEETARIVFKQQGFAFAAVDTQSNFDRYLQIQRMILRTQLEAEDEALRTSKWFVSDRSGIDCLVYASKYVGKEGAEALSQTHEFKQLRARMQEGRIIVCEPVVEWLKDDGTGFRPMPELKEEWLAVHVEFCELLGGLGLKYDLLPSHMTSIEERVAFALQ